MQRKQSLGKPDQKDLNENLAATQGLAHMIAECKKLFQVRSWEILSFVKENLSRDKISLVRILFTERSFPHLEIICVSLRMSYLYIRINPT